MENERELEMPNLEAVEGVEEVGRDPINNGELNEIINYLERLEGNLPPSPPHYHNYQQQQQQQQQQQPQMQFHICK